MRLTNLAWQDIISYRYKNITTRRKPLTPDDLSPLCDEPQLADVDLHDGSLCDDSQAGVQWRRWVLLHPQDGQAERCLELWMSDVGFLKPQSLGSYGGK